MQIKRFSRAATLLALILAGLSPWSAAQATTIEYVATNLTDVTPGEDLWRYDYRVSGRSFLQFQFFDIYFQPTLFAALASQSSANSDWDAAILQQPTPGNLPPFDRGMFDAFALVDNASLTGMFSVSFIYLGSGSPGSQPFEIFDAGSNLLETGMTSVPGGAIPEPSTLALLAGGLLLGALRLRRMRP
jgi:hypothetical protein